MSIDTFEICQRLIAFVFGRIHLHEIYTEWLEDVTASYGTPLDSVAFF